MSKNVIHNSIAVILRVDKKILICQRQFSLTAFAGHWTFPGGRIDLEDSENKIDLGLNYPNEELGALFREAREELAIDIPNDFKKGLIAKIEKLRTCISPDFNPHRYETHFYLVDYKKLPKIDYLIYEINQNWWAAPEEIFKKYNEGKLLTVPPILYLLQDLMKLKFEYLEHSVPWTEMIKGLVQIMPKSLTLPPADRTNAFYIEGLLVDPSPKDDEEYENFLKTLSFFKKPFAVFLTHHHPDHVQYGPRLASEFNIPIWLSEYTYKRLIKKRGDDFFKNCKIEFKKENDVITTWLGQEVQCIEVPGHDEGQLALMPQSKDWFIAGDLFQGIGSVVIPLEEGNMRKYMDSLRKVINLKPKVIVPSHGIPIGSTYVLEKILRHREKRLTEVKTHYEQGLSPEEIVEKIYIKLTNPKLRELAKENVLKNIELINEKNGLDIKIQN